MPEVPTPPKQPDDGQHWLPDGVKPGSVDLSLVVPALNEEITVGEFVDWCHEGLKKAGVAGQILIIDSSTDETPRIVLQHGGEVLHVPKRGLGRAYIDAIPYIRGKWIIMGDSDLTYDFRELGPFLEKFRLGYEFVMGSRFRGRIEPGAMPLLHRYLGTPVTTWLLNRIYGTKFSDIHCGMRGVTLDGFKRMRMRSQSWQYASEMIIKSQHLRLRTSEVPIIFHKDRKNRMSHMKRAGWWSPWHAAWINIQAMFTHGADFFLFRPGIILAVVGLVGTMLLFNGPVRFGEVELSLHWMMLFLIATLVGIQSTLMGALAKVLYDPERRNTGRLQRCFTFNRATLVLLAFLVAGGFSVSGLIFEYVELGYRLPPAIGQNSYRAVAGLGMFFSGAIYFTFSLVFNALVEFTSAPKEQ